MSADSIDVVDTIQIEVEIRKDYAEKVFHTNWESTPQDTSDPEHISEIKYENIEISEHIDPMFTDEQLIACDGTLETEMSLETIKALSK